MDALRGRRRASSELGWDPNKQRFKAQATANAQAKLILFEGKWVHTLSIPSTKGWQMNFGGMDLGRSSSSQPASCTGSWARRRR